MEILARLPRFTLLRKSYVIRSNVAKYTHFCKVKGICEHPRINREISLTVLSVLSSFSNKNCDHVLLAFTRITGVLCRNKHTKGIKKGNEETEELSDEELDEEEADASESGAKVLNIYVSSLRVDAFLAAGLGISRNKIDVAFYGDKIRVNGMKLLKKGRWLSEGDEVDIIRGPNMQNPSFLNISKLVLVSVHDKGMKEKFKIQVHRFQDLLVENYEDPWKPTFED